MEKQQIEKLISYSLIASLLLLLALLSIPDSGKLKYESEEECVLENIGKSDADGAPNVIRRACHDLFRNAELLERSKDVDLDPFAELPDIPNANSLFGLPQN